MIGPLDAADAADAAAMSATFGWPHRAADWDLFLRIGRGVAWREGGTLGGTAMWFPLDAAHGAIGLVQVAPALQGRGLGRRLMRAVIEDAGARGLLLHATAEGAGLYASLGFVAGDVVQQWQGEATLVPRADADVRVAVRADRAAIGRLDIAATGLSRTALLDALMADAAVAIAGPAEAPTGYAVRRRFGRGALIGPLAALDTEVAVDLVRFLAGTGFLRMDVPEGELTAWLAGSGLTQVGAVQAMMLGDWPVPVGPARRMGLASQALG